MSFYSDTLVGLSNEASFCSDTLVGLSNEASFCSDTLNGLSNGASFCSDTLVGLSSGASFCSDTLVGLSSGASFCSDTPNGLSNGASFCSDTSNGLSNGASFCSDALVVKFFIIDGPPFALKMDTYSSFSVSTGLIVAARQLCHETAATEMTSTPRPVSPKSHQSRGAGAAKFSSQRVISR